MKINDITGLILAGGRGTRMGNVDKGLQLLKGEPMALHVLRRLAPQVGPVIINANRNLDAYTGFRVQVVSDEIDGFAGPLAGLHAGLRHCRTPYLTSAPCDSPFLPEDLVARLSTALEQQQADLAMAVTGDGETRQEHPVFCLTKTSLLASLTDFLKSGGRKPVIWFASLRLAQVHFENEAAFDNINTVDELTRHDD